MGTWTAWALALVQPLIARALVALGLSVVTMAGMDVVMGQLTQQVTSAWGALPGALVSLLQFAGVGKAMGIIGAAIATKIFIITATKSVKFASKTPG